MRYKYIDCYEASNGYQVSVLTQDGQTIYSLKQVRKNMKDFFTGFVSGKFKKLEGDIFYYSYNKTPSGWYYIPESHPIFNFDFIVKIEKYSTRSPRRYALAAIIQQLKQIVS